MPEPVITIEQAYRTLERENATLRGQCQAYQHALRIAEARDTVKNGHRSRELRRVVKEIMKEIIGV